MRARTRVKYTRHSADRHLFVGPASVLTHAGTRVTKNGIGGGKLWEKEGCRWIASGTVEGAFHLVAFTQETTYVNALVFITSGRHVRV